MVTLIILNIILIIVIVFLLIYFLRNKKYDEKNTCINDNEYFEKEIVNKQTKKIKSENVFEGVFITDDEYQEMMENRRSDISILLEDIEKEYEHLKELRK